MQVNRVMIAAPKSGSGKTIITCALLQALKNRGQQVVSCKCGPDYIDPMFHEKVIGIPAKNLDTFFTNAEQTRRLFLDSIVQSQACYAVFEGVMGLFDGLGGIREEGSSYHLAKVTRTPIILVVDAKGMGRSVIPLIAGFLSYDSGHLIQGVILNRISKGYFEILRPLVEKELKIRMIGFLPEKQEFHIGSRHLGLLLPNECSEEMKDIQERLQQISEVFQQTVSLEDMIKIAESAEEIDYSAKNTKTIADGNHIARSITQPQDTGTTADSEKEQEISGTVGRAGGTTQDRAVIAVARDEAFCFYYADNLRLLQEYGAQITYFSLLHDEKLPDQCHGLLIGGGYPELYAQKLSQNNAMRAAVRQAAENGMLIVAECGGFMYLHSAIVDKEGIRYDMAGVIPAMCYDAGKLVRFGYIEIQEKQCCFLPEGGRIKGHEFHYYDSTDNGSDAIAVKPVTGKRYSCIMEGETYWMGFAHLYYPSNPMFAKQFVTKAQRYREVRKHGKFISIF